jgi:hypothetical protein
MNRKLQVVTSLMVLGILLAGVAGCASQSTPPSVSPTSTLPPGWVTYSNDPVGQCGFAIDHPSDLEGTSQGKYSSTFNRTTTDPNGPYPNFIYISVIPDDFQSAEPGTIYNYDPAETQTLLNIPVGESRSLREDPNLAPSFTYTRQPDTTLGDQSAQTYENTQPWEFPPSTKEIRYYLKGSGCTFLVGGYLSTVGSGQLGAIDEDLFEQIITTLRIR